MLASIGWTWAILLLRTRLYLVGLYSVIPPSLPLWEPIAFPLSGIAAAVALGLFVALAAMQLARQQRCALPLATRWLLLAWFVPALDAARLAGLAIPHTFLEPILLTGITGIAVSEMARALPAPGSHQLATLLCRSSVVLLAAVAFAAWWYLEGVRTYNNYLLGYNDFGHFAYRVASTWAGRGFLQETPALPAFWDHFNPGLALFAPLWGLWPDARLFILTQAICLAIPAVLVHGICRESGADAASSTAWAGAYLMFPAVGQLNLNYSFGWHPITPAIPLVFGCVWLLLRGRRWLAGGLALLACSLQEDILVVVGGLAAAMALRCWLDRRLSRFAQKDALPEMGEGQASRLVRASTVGQPLPEAERPPHVATLIARRFPPWGWIAIAGGLTASFLLIFKFAAFSTFQVSRFRVLGESAGEVLLSPLLRPTVFWGTVFQRESAYFLLLLFAPLGPRNHFRGRTVLLASVLPLGVLLAWNHIPAKCIAFQYTTALIPVFFLSALAGAASRSGAEQEQEDERAAGRHRGLWASGIGSCAACTVASVWLGALPWSGQTLADVWVQTYSVGGEFDVLENRQAGSPGQCLLEEIVRKVGRKDVSVLATGRLAAHLLQVRRLDTVGQARTRWDAFQIEVGDGRSPLELFDWVAVDTVERFYQSNTDTAFILDEVRLCSYELVLSGHGVFLYGRPSLVRRERVAAQAPPGSDQP